MSALMCPVCGRVGCGVLDNRLMPSDSFSVSRRRQCARCGARFQTVETAVYDQNTWADAQKIEDLKAQQPLDPDVVIHMLSRALDDLGQVAVEQGIAILPDYRARHYDALTIAKRRLEGT